MTPGVSQTVSNDERGRERKRCTRFASRRNTDETINDARS
jgi:hypothetical protein